MYRRGSRGSAPRGAPLGRISQGLRATPAVGEQRTTSTVESENLVQGAINGRLEGACAQKLPDGGELVVVDFDQSLRHAPRISNVRELDSLDDYRIRGLGVRVPPSAQIGAGQKAFLASQPWSTELP